jgi:hypothetical protein
MNKLSSSLLLIFVLLAGVFLAGGAGAQGKKTPGGEEFFIISSVDTSKSQLLLKRPTEVTLLMKVGDKTQIQDEKGKPVHLSDLRAGDTVWVISVAGDNNQPLASRIRRGPMTVDDLHKYFLDYPKI